MLLLGFIGSLAASGAMKHGAVERFEQSHRGPEDIRNVANHDSHVVCPLCTQTP